MESGDATPSPSPSTMAVVAGQQLPVVRAGVAAEVHPLQDVDLDATSMEAATPTKNWVKFDDDTATGATARHEDNNHKRADSGVNVVHAGGQGAKGGNSKGHEHGPPSMLDDNMNDALRSSAATTVTTTTVATTTVATTTTASFTPSNKLSPPPSRTPRQSPTTTLAATNTRSAAVGVAAAVVEKSMNKHPTTVAPVQRTAAPLASGLDIAPAAVLATESTHVNLNSAGKTQPHQPQQSLAAKVAATPLAPPLHGQQQQQQQQQLQQQQSHNNVAGNNGPNVMIAVEAAPPMRTIELSTGRIREGFGNGDVIVTLLPANTKWPWITPAIFRPELVPEELMAQGLTLTVEEYVHAMETLVNDFRFTVYNVCYKRILVCWILFAFVVLLTLLFSGLQGVALFSLGVGWLFLNAAAIFLCMWIKLRLSRGLEKCLARVNRQLMRHKILLVLDDRGRISCHKVNLCFLYFDASQCVAFLNDFLEHTEQNGGEAIKAGWEAKLDIDLSDIVIQGANPVRLSRKQERGTQLYLRYGSRWGMDALRGLIDVTPLGPGRHCARFQCPCQYIEQHLQCKPRGYPCSSCGYIADPVFQSRY